MSDVVIDSLKIEAKTNIKDAISDIEALKKALSGLGEGTSGVAQYQYAVNALVQKLSKLNGITNKSGQDAVRKAINDVAKAYMDFDTKSRNAASTQEEVDRALENVQDKIAGVSQAIAMNVREIRETSEEAKKLVDYINGISGKIKIDPISIKSSFDPKDYMAMRSVLGKKFTSTGDGLDFETFITNMNQDIGTTFDVAQGLDTVFEQLVNRMREIHRESRTLSVAEIFQRGLIPEKEIESETSHFVAQLDNLKAKFNFSEADLFGDEGEQISSLRDEVKLVTSAITGKNKAFEKEQEIVNKIVASEMKDLSNLEASINAVTKSVSGNNGLAAALNTLNTSGLADLAALKGIDFSGIAKLNKGSIAQIIDSNTQVVPDINDLIDKALNPITGNTTMVNFADELKKIMNEVNEASRQFFGEFYVPEDAKELQSEFTAISEEIVRIKGVIQDALRSGDTGGIDQLKGDLAQAQAYFHDLALSAQQSGIELREIPTEMERAEAASRAATQAFNQLNPELQQTDNIISHGNNDIPNFYEELHQMGVYGTQTAGSLQKTAAALDEFAVKVPSITKLIKSVASVIRVIGRQTASLGKDFTKLSWQALNFGSGKSDLSGLKNPFSKSSESLGDFNGKLKHGIQMLMRYGFGVRSLYVLFNKLRSGIKDGFNNLVLYSDKANQSISLLQADLSYLGNSVAAAFEPILNIVAPIIDQIVDYMVAGINSVGAFIAAITGQSSYTVAVKNIKDYRDSLNGTAEAGDAAGDATDNLKDKAEELKRELMGFDEIEKFSEDLDSVTDSGTGSGNGSGNNSTEDPILFTKKDIPGAASNFAELVKEAWEKADFTEIGNIVGTKLKDALDSIDWDPIKETSNKIAVSTATFINGFFETSGLDESVGRTLGEAVNTAVGSINTFVDATHWDSLGEFVSGGLRSSIDTIDWDGLGKALNAKYTALWSFIDGFVVDMSKIGFEGTTGWQEAGNALAETINGIFADRDYESVGKTIADGINGIATILDTGVAKIEFDKISQNFASGVNNIFSGVDFDAVGAAISAGLNQATSSLRTFTITIDWIQIGSELASAANTLLADTDFTSAGEAVGEAFKNALEAINELAATFNWRSLGIDINNFIKGINWKGILKTGANTVANVFFGLFEAAWAVVFGGPDTKYTAIADNLNQALSKLKVEWPAMEQEEIEKFNNVSTIVDKFLELNEKLKNDGSLSETDMSLFKTYYDQIVEYAPQAAELIGEVGAAYEGTDEALRSLIENQKNAAIAQGFQDVIADLSKNYADSMIALNGAVSDLVDSALANKDAIYGEWIRSGATGSMDDMIATMDKLFQKMRDGKYDVDELEGAEATLAIAIGLADNGLQKKITTVQNLSTNLHDSRDELDKVILAEQEFADQTGSTTSKTKRLGATVAGSYKTILKNAEAVDSKNRTMQEHIAVWLSDLNELSEEEKSVLFDYMTGTSDKTGAVTSAISKLNKSQKTQIEATGKAWRTLESDAKNYGITIGNLPTEVTTEATFKVDKSEIYKTGKDLLSNPLELNSKMVVSGVDKSKLTSEDKTFNTIARFNSMIDALGAKLFDVAANFTSRTDNLPGWSKVFDTIAKFTSKEDAIGDRKISNLTAIVGSITPTVALAVSNVTGYISRVQKQSGVSLILSGIVGAVTSIFKKADGGAYYGGMWHDIPQFSSGGIITPSLMAKINAIPRYAGGTLDAGSMFIAGEAGPELVGHVGGRTEVLNQSQLASVMESSVASGMEAVMSRYGSGGSGNVTVNVVLQGDAKKIFEVVKKENNSRVIQTGKAQLLT